MNPTMFNYDFSQKLCMNYKEDLLTQVLFP